MTSTGGVVTLPPMHECEELHIKFVSDAGPWKAWMFTGTGGAGTILGDFGTIQNPEIGFFNDLGRGYVVQLAVRDSAGRISISQPTTILPGAPGACPPGFNLRTLAAASQGGVVKDPSPTSSSGPPVPPANLGSKPTTSSSISAFTSSSKDAIPPEPTPAPGSITGTASGFGTSSSISKPLLTPNEAGQSVSSPGAYTPPISSSSTEPPVGPFVPISALTKPASQQPSSTISFYTSASSTFPIIPIQSEASSLEEPHKSNATMIAGIAGGVSCFLLFFGLIFYVLCRHRRQNIQSGGRTSDDDYVHFSDTASTRVSFPPIYANFPADNMAGRGAGGIDDGTGDEDAKKDMAGLGQGQMGHIPYINPDFNFGAANTVETASVSPYDMGSRPILDPAILGRSGPKSPKSRSTWRSSFGAVLNFMAPPSPGVTRAFRLGSRGSVAGTRRYDGEGSETLTGVSRTNTLQTQRSAEVDSTFGGCGPAAMGASSGAGVYDEKRSIPYRASASTCANIPPPLLIANPTTPSTPHLTTLSTPNPVGGPVPNANARALIPRRDSDATIQTARSRRSIATFGAADLSLIPYAALRSPTFPAGSGGDRAGSSPAVLPSPASEASFGDLAAHPTELGYNQPTPTLATTPSAYKYHSGSLAEYQLPPIPSSFSEDGVHGQAEGVVSRVSIAKFERPRTLMFTRNSLAGSAFGASTTSVQSHSGTVVGEDGGERRIEGMAGDESGNSEAALRRGSAIGGKWSEWRASLRRSLGGDVGQAL